ncbi:MAG: hypothetical protein JWM51_1287 [Microbacteriaceae bacterium]|jgi:hypothetical protein|nr:hypothetical protein [Microbacteriaceae bacterium]
MAAKLPWWDRLNGALRPYIGPPPLGPYGEPPLPPSAGKACPLCGQPMADHRFDRSTDHNSTRMYCPTDAR